MPKKDTIVAWSGWSGGTKGVYMDYQGKEFFRPWLSGWDDDTIREAVGAPTDTPVEDNTRRDAQGYNNP